jgi:hypothetical protein
VSLATFDTYGRVKFVQFALEDVEEFVVVGPEDCFVEPVDDIGPELSCLAYWSK